MTTLEDLAAAAEREAIARMADQQVEALEWLERSCSSWDAARADMRAKAIALRVFAAAIRARGKKVLAPEDEK